MSEPRTQDGFSALTHICGDLAEKVSIQNFGSILRSAEAVNSSNQVTPQSNEPVPAELVWMGRCGSTLQ